MHKNAVRRKLQCGQSTFGALMSIGSVEVVEYSTRVGLDWICLDWQHGAWSESALRNALTAFTNSETVPLVRIRGHSSWEVGRVLDMGAMGVVAPLVNTPEEATKIVRAAKYPPDGSRSAGGMRLSVLSDGLDNNDYLANANNEILVIVMAETIRAAKRAEDILSVSGVDVVLIGPTDLLLDVKADGGGVEERDRLAVSVCEAGKKIGKPTGYVAPGFDEALSFNEKGFRFISTGSDTGLIRSGLSRGVKKLIERRTEE